MGATTSCLRALGVECDKIDVAGMSGYAFHFCIRDNVCPSGPTLLNLEALSYGTQFLGRSTAQSWGVQGFAPGELDEHSRSQCRAAFELAKRELDAGRPCVVAGVSQCEFGFVVGYDGDSYVNQDGHAVRYDQIDPSGAGGAYVLGFPGTVASLGRRATRYALHNATAMFNNPFWPGTDCGGKAYDQWMRALRERRADAFGCGYNAACYAEGRRLAHGFLHRLTQSDDFLAAALSDAVVLYERAAQAMETVERLLPVSGGDGAIRDDGRIAQAVEALRTAREAECQAIERLVCCVRMEWPA